MDCSRLLRVEGDLRRDLRSQRERWRRKEAPRSRSCAERRRARLGLLRCRGAVRGCLWHGPCTGGAETHFVRCDLVLVGGSRARSSRKCSILACVGCIKLLLVEFELVTVVAGPYVIGVSVRAIENIVYEVKSGHLRSRPT